MGLSKGTEGETGVSVYDWLFVLACVLQVDPVDVDLLFFGQQLRRDNVFQSK